jgi:hypothetical protein
MSDRVKAFAEAAQAFCVWAEAAGSADELAEATEARRLLAWLVATAVHLELPLIPEDAPDRDSPETDREQYKTIYRRFGSLPFNYYSEIFDPLVVPAEESVTADIADYLADIWSDLRGGLHWFNLGDIQAATWEWCFSYSSHWGHHATGALYALQTWFSREGDDRRWQPSN